MSQKIRQNVPLAPLTTIGMGGDAKYFITCHEVNEIIEALSFAKKNNLPTYILGGGSNTIFTGKYFPGLVIHIDLKGVTFKEENSHVIAGVKAGENWDEFVSTCVNKGLSGIECLSGIPGSVGATPMQNVGAYGQSVADTILKVKAIKRDELSLVEFDNKECRFGYRQSRFKQQDSNQYIITEVHFKLTKNGVSDLKYPELIKAVQNETGDMNIGQGEKALNTVRDTVIKLRKKKSMIVDPNDSHSKSCGSFFMNPVLSPTEFKDLTKKWTVDIPHFSEGSDIKIPAGWLIENSGFKKGYKHGNVGISENHTLALVNYGGSAEELLNLAEKIQNQVNSKFGILLNREPVIVSV